MSTGSDQPQPGNLDRLLLQATRNDRVAFEELYRRTSPRLLGVCARMLTDLREAEEVLQEVFVTVWQRGTTFDPSRAKALAWLVALARNKAIDRLRRRREFVHQADFQLEAVLDESPTASAQIERSEESRRLDECMKELESQQRRSIQEAFFSGTTYDALAKRARVPLGTMKSWIRRGLLQLRACLET